MTEKPSQPGTFRDPTGSPFAARRLAAALALVVVAALLVTGRRAYIQAFFVDGPAPELRVPPPMDAPPTRRVRVILLDGLSRAIAATLPNLNQLCAQGQDLTVDVGFPTVSLPVQHVLWTGLSQQESGVQYRVRAPEEPYRHALPARLPDSLAVAESHDWIARAFGFRHVEPPAHDEDEGDDEGEGEEQARLQAQAAWAATGFPAAARTALGSDASLAFVHVLRIDEAGHEGGMDERYLQAANQADTWLREWVSQAGPEGAAVTDQLAFLPTQEDQPPLRWFVLSDHGHRVDGGHGGHEPGVRLVRACIFGAGVAPEAPRAQPIALTDLHRQLAESIGLPIIEREPPPDGARPTWAASPPRLRPGVASWMAAGGIVALGLLATFGVMMRAPMRWWQSLRAPTRWWQAPWWMAVSYLSVWALGGAPTLSNPMVYPPLGLNMALFASPGLLVLAFATVSAPPHWPLRATVGAPLILPLALTAAAWVLGGGTRFLLDAGPPLVPRWTAHASLFLTLSASACLVAALSLLAHAARARFGRSPPAETAGTAP